MTSFPRIARRLVCGLTAACVLLTSTAPAVAGGFTFDLNALVPSLSDFNWNFTSPVDAALPTFDNQFFNDINLVGAINNDFIRTPSTADPVSTVSGNNYRDETDFNIKGRNGLNYVFTRTYNSESRNKQRGLGYGWSHSYGMTLRSNDFSKWPNCQNNSAKCPENNDGKTSSITYTDERGGDHNYLLSSAGQVTPPVGEFESLLLNTPSVGKHTLQFRNGNKYVFETVNAQGQSSTASADYLHVVPGKNARLASIANPWGDVLTLTYDASGKLTTVADNLGIAGRTGLVFTYHTDGVLKDVSDWTGRLWRYDYTNGNMDAVTNPMSVLVRYGYDSRVPHFLVSVTRPTVAGSGPRVTSFQPYANGRTFKQNNADGSGDTLDYDLFRRTTRVTNAEGDVREFVYDQYGGMTRLTEADGGVHLFENQADTLRFKKTDPQGYSTSYSYRGDRTIGATLASDTGGMVTLERDALNKTIETSYGPYGQVAKVKDKRGFETETTFFPTGANQGWKEGRPWNVRVKRLTVAPGDVRTDVYLKYWYWNPDGTLWQVIDQLSPNVNTHRRFTTYAYQAGSNGLNVESITVFGQDDTVSPAVVTASVRKSFTYDSLGRVKSETLKRRKSPTDATLIDITTSYDYDALDRVIKVTDNAGSFTRYLYTDAGLSVVEQNLKKPDGSFEIRNSMSYGRDAADKITSATNTAGKATTYIYDRAGNVLSAKDPLGHVTRYEYDGAGRKTALIDATGYRTTMAYDLRGNPVSVTNANGETTRFEYDALGRLTDTVDARGYRSRRGYDASGNLTCVIDANAEAGLQPKNAQGCTTEYRYDELNRVVKVVDAKDGETDYTYDLLGNRLTVTDPARKVWRFTYDDMGRLSAEVDHRGKTITYKRDEVGNVYEKTDRLNQVSRFTFDNLNRLKEADYANGSILDTFGYDVAGNLNSAMGNRGVSTYGFVYDNMNRLTAKTDSRGKALSFTYDDAGNIRTKTTYQGTTTTYQYNAANRLVQLRNPDYLQVDYQYDQAGRLRGRVMSSGARSIYNYDANGWLTDLTHYDAKNAQIASSSYSRDRMGNVLTQVDSGGPLPGTRGYTYDSLYRLLTADLPGTVNDEVYTYDSVGNRLTATKGTTTLYYSYTLGTNRLATVGTGTSANPGTALFDYGYNDEGQVVLLTDWANRPNSRVFLWNVKGQMSSVQYPEVTPRKVENFTYDALGKRIQRTGGTLGNLDYFLEGEHLESVYSGGQLQAKYFRGGSVDELVAAYSYEGGKLKPQFFAQDALSSTHAVGGHNGGVTQALTYSSFGSVLASSGSSANRLKYTGREDDGTGLYYYRARFYDPAIGRFISEDPKGFEAGINFYAYAGNNPVNGNDPYGEEVVINRSGPGLKTLDVQYNKVFVYAGPRDPADVAKDMAGVEKSLSGSFPPYTVTTSINWQFTDNVSQAMKDPKAIVVQYMSMEYLDAARSESGAFLGYVPAQRIPAFGGLSSTLQFGSAAEVLDKSHEFGHEGGMAGAKHLGMNGLPIPPTDAMAAAPNRDASFSGQDFTAMLWAAGNIVNPPVNPTPPAAAAGSPSRITTLPSALAFDYLDAVYRK
jgi:RHS repeat-associated protein